MSTPLAIVNQTGKKKRFLDANYKMLHYLGLWSSDDNRGPRKTWKYFRSLLPAMQLYRLMYATIFHACAVMAVWHEPHERVKEFGLLACASVILIKLGLLMHRKERIAKIFDTFETLNGESCYVNEECERKRLSAEIRCRKITRGFLGFILVGNAIISLLAVRQTLDVVFLPLNIWLPEKTVWYYLLFGVTMFLFSLSGADMFTVALMDVTLVAIHIQIISQFDILRHKLENIRAIVENQLQRRVSTTVDRVQRELSLRQGSGCNNLEILVTFLREESGRCLETKDESEVVSNLTETPPPDDISLEMEEYLKNCVKHHEILIMCCTECQSIFNPVLAYQVVFTATISMGALFISILVSKTGGEFEKIIYAVIIMIGGAIEFFALCIFCDKIKEKGSLIREAAYACDWVEASEGFKLSLRIIQSRTLKPVIFRAMGIPLSLPIFKAGMRAVYYIYNMTFNIMSGKKIN